MKEMPELQEPIQRDERFIERCVLFSEGAGISVALVGGLILAGWLFGIPALLWTPAGMVTMKANTGLCLVLGGCSLFVLSGNRGGSSLRSLAGIAGLLVAVIGFLTLCEYATGWDAGIDQLIARELPGAVKTSSPGRMAPNAALNFTLIGTAFVLLSRRIGGWTITVLSFLAGAIALHALMGYAYAGETLDGFLPYTHIAVHTALSLMLLAAGTILTQPDRGVMDALSRKSAAAAQVRRLLPAVILIPFVLAWIRYEGYRSGLFGDEFGVAIMIVSSSAALAGVIMVGLLALNESDRERSRAYGELRIEQRFRIAVEESILTGIAATDVNHRLIYVNPAFCAMVGWKEEELIGKGPPYPFYHPEERRAVLAVDAAIRRGRLPQRGLEFRLRRSDGETIFISAYLSRLRDERERDIGTLGAITDITEKKLREREQARTAEILERIFSNVQFSIVYLDRDFNFIRVNEAYAKACGHPPAFFVGKNHFDLYPAQETEVIFRTVVETGEPFVVFARPFEFPDHPEWGVTYWDWNLQPVKEPGGELSGLIFCLDDVTKRVRAEAGLKESEERLELSVEAADLGLWDWDIGKGEVVYSERWASMLGYSVPEIGSTFADWERLVHPDDLAGAVSRLTLHLEGRSPFYEAEFRMKAKSGEWRWILSRGKVTERNEEGLALRATGIHQDFTRVKEMEQAVVRQGKMAILGQMAAGIAHEIRNPLSGLNIYLAAAEKLAFEAEFPEPSHREALTRSLGTARAASVKIEGVIRRVMDFVKPSPSRLVPLQINDVVTEALELAGVTIRKSGIRLLTSLPEGLPPCRGDARLLEQLVLNLVTNAAQAMERQEGEKRIEISTGQEGGSLLLQVADSGPGIPTGIREKIFEPFFTTKTSGTGLGLSISSRIVSEHGGFLGVGKSSIGGAEFRVMLPVDRGEQPD